MQRFIFTGEPAEFWPFPGSFSGGILFMPNQLRVLEEHSITTRSFDVSFGTGHFLVQHGYNTHLFMQHGVLWH